MRIAIVAGVLVSTILQIQAVEFHVAVGGTDANPGTPARPLSFAGAIAKASDTLGTSGLPADGLSILIHEGRYRFPHAFRLGPEFAGDADRPIVIRAAEGATVVFDGAMTIPSTRFRPLVSSDEIGRVPAAARDHILVATVDEPDLIAQFNGKLLLNMSYDGRSYLPSVFPNQGYASLEMDTVRGEVCPPGVPVGKENYGIRAGNPPHQEPGKPQRWRGSLKEPRGAKVRIADQADTRAGTWAQWERELARNNRRNRLTGFIEANWLLSAQSIVAADAATESIHLSQALAYGWAWRKDKPFRIFGLLCELDAPGEWHFDPLTNRLFLYPPHPIRRDTEIALSVANGFLHLDGTSHVVIRGLTVRNVGGGSVFKVRGKDNVISGCVVRDCTATGLDIAGSRNAAKGCDLIDLTRHAALSGGRRSPTEITPGGNAVENCHIYQKYMSHEKVNVTVIGIGNRFANNLVHNSLGQAVVVNGNDHVLERNEFFNVGYDEGDGGAVYSGADMTGYGATYRHNFFHHLMHVPGKVERSGIHLDDLQAGSICDGNIFFKSAGKGIHMNGGAGHILKNNVFLDGFRGIYNTAGGGQRSYDRQLGIDADPNHVYRNTKENYIGRAERIVGPRGWENSPWKEAYPLMFEVLNDAGVYGRYWPIRCVVANNYYYRNQRGDHTIWSRASKEVLAKNVFTNEQLIAPEQFTDYDQLDLSFKPGQEGLPPIPFHDIGLRLDEHRSAMPDKANYRSAVRERFRGIPCMPGTRERIDTAKVVEEGPIVTR